MAFNLPFGVRVAGNDPVDKDRYQVGTIAERDQLVTDGRAYDGLQVYVISDQTVFILKGTTNSDWEIFGNGTGTGGTDYVSNITLNGTDLEVTGVGNAFSSTVDLSSLSGGLQNVVEDLTPELGGNLEIGENSITSSTSGIVEFNVTPRFSISRFDFSGFLKANDFGNLVSTSQMTLGLEDSRSSLIDLYAGNGTLGGRVRFWNGNNFRAHDFWIVGSKSINTQDPHNFSIAFGDDVGDPRDMGTPVFEIDATTKQIIFSQYGSNNFTGTATQYLAVDVDGNIIEEPIPVGGGGGSTDYVSDITLNGSSLEITGIGNAFNSTVDLSSLTGTSLTDGGTTNQALRKLSNTDQDFDWQDDPATEWSEIEGNQKDVNLIGFTDGTLGLPVEKITELPWYDNTGSFGASFGNNIYVATGQGGDFYTSSDAITWTPVIPNGLTGSGFNSIAFGNGTFVVASISDSSTDKIATSSDGLNWTPRTHPDNIRTYDLIFANGLFVAIGSGDFSRVYTSPDGITWTKRTAPSGTWRSITYGDGLFVVVGESSGTRNVMVSSDAITWSGISVNTSFNWIDITFGNGIFIAVNRSFGQKIMTSSDGTNWVLRDINFETRFSYGITFSNGNFYAIGVKETDTFYGVHKSADGITWNELIESTQKQYSFITETNNVVLGFGGGSPNDQLLITFESFIKFENIVNEYRDSNGNTIPIINKVLQLPASTGGSAPSTKQKQYFQAVGEMELDDVTKWYTFDSRYGARGDIDRATNDNSGLPVTQWGSSGIMIPKGSKINRVIIFLRATNGPTDIRLAFYKKTFNLSDGDYQNATNAQNDFTLIYDDNYFAHSSLPAFSPNNGISKRTFIMPDTGGVNAATNKDIMFCPYFKAVGASVTAIYDLILEMEEL